MESPVVNRGSHPMRAVAGDKRLAADKVIERLLHSLKAHSAALVEKEHAERVAQSRRAVYFVLTFAAGLIAGVLLMKGLLAQHLI
jgi:F0F1-type ATP synthase assembly protein I